MPRFRTTARAVGILMLGAFLLYGVGTAIAATAASGPMRWGGVGLMLLNSVAVIAIGVLIRPVLRPRAPATARIYLGTRIVEGVLLAGGAVGLLAGNVQANFVAYNLGMAVLGLGSLFFCAALYRLRLVPRLLAAWGLVGYAAFAAGTLLELAGISDAGLYGAGPGGLFEVVFAIWLIARGFSVGREFDSRSAAQPVTAANGP